MYKYMKLLDFDIEKLDWSGLSANPRAIHLLEQNQDKINWWSLLQNPAAIRLISEELEQNPDNFNWWSLSLNPAAIHLLEQNQDKIDWDELSKNISIFVYDYEKMATDFIPLRKAIIENRFHPKNIDKFNGWGFNIYDESDSDD